jgi:hypothetical protein
MNSLIYYRHLDNVAASKWFYFLTKASDMSYGDLTYTGTAMDGIYTSRDGVEWEFEEVDTGSLIYSVAQNNFNVVAVGGISPIRASPGRIYYRRAPDQPWIMIETPYCLLTVTITPLCFFAGGLSGQIFVSEQLLSTYADTLAWKEYSIGTKEQIIQIYYDSQDPEYFFDDCFIGGLSDPSDDYGDSRKLALTINGSVYVSWDWNESIWEKLGDIDADTVLEMSNMCWRNGLYVAVGKHGAIYTSEDAETWEHNKSAGKLP